MRHLVKALLVVLLISTVAVAANCPKCGSMVSAGDRPCAQCGTKSPHTSQKDPASRPAARTTTQQAADISSDEAKDLERKKAQYVAASKEGWRLYGAGKHAKAAVEYEKALSFAKEFYGEEHPETAQMFHNLAYQYAQLGQHAKAEPLYLRSLVIKEAKLGKDHPDVAASLRNLAMLYTKMGRYAKAEPLFLRSLKIKEASQGKNHPDVAMGLKNLAWLYVSMGEFAKAEPLYLRSLEINEAKLGKDHPDVAASLYSLALLYQKMGRYAKAEPPSLRSLEIWEAKLGKDHPNVAALLGNLAFLSMIAEKGREALTYQGRARRIARRHVSGVLPALSRPEQLTFLRHKDRGSFSRALSMGLSLANRADAVASSAEWLLNGKAVTLEALSARARLALDSRNASVAATAGELISVRARLARLTLSPTPQEDCDSYRKRVAVLAERERKLAKELGQVTGQAHRGDPWVKLEEVRRNLPKGAVLVELARFGVFNYRAKGTEKRWLPSRYVAWVIPATGGSDVGLVDLGEAETIDNAVAAYRELALRSRARIREAGASVAEKELRSAGEKLAKLIWEPLKGTVGDAKQVIVSPDGALWLVPWEALPVDGNKHLIEEKQISYVVSGRDLVTGGYTTKSSGGVVLADPEYDLGASEVVAETKRILEGDRVAVAGERSGHLSRTRWKRLSGTAAEAKAVAPKLERYVGRAPAVHTGKQALEGVCKALRSPRVLLMSTHGFFLPDQDYTNMPVPVPANLGQRGTILAPRKDALQARPRPFGKKSVAVEDPLLRCGLVLAGANHRDRASAGDDGILTALEIVGTDLRGTELVVLSACETGLGKVQNAEGVAGLRQAFQIAGAKTVVCTLWRIPDKETTALMTAFFENLAAGQGKAEALRNAQLKQMRQRRKDAGAAHPYYWAAFTLTGKWR